MQRFLGSRAASAVAPRLTCATASSSVAARAPLSVAAAAVQQRRFFAATAAWRCNNTAAEGDASSSSSSTGPNFLALARNLINQPLSSRVQINAQSFSVLEILNKSLEAPVGGGLCGHQKSEVWYTCGLVLSHAAGGDAVDSSHVTFGGKEYNARECFVKAVACDANNSIAWNNLGVSLQHDETIALDETNGERVDRHACFKKAAQCDPQNDRAWFNLGANFTPDGSGLRLDGHGTLTRADCFVKALTINPSNSNGWYNLGVTLGGTEVATISGTKYTSQQCFVKAIEIDPRNTGAWNYLGATIPEGEMAPLASGEKVGPRQCFVRAIEADPASPAAGVSWNNLATTLNPNEHAAVAGRAFNVVQCYAKAVECDQTDSKAWQKLGITMEPGMKVSIYGTDYSQQDCFIKAIEHDNEDAMAWHNAGATIRGRGDTITIRGKARTQRECFIKSLERDPMNSIGWYVVGTSLNAALKETCSILGKHYTALDCFIKTVGVDPHNSLMWNNLAAAIPKGHIVDIPITQIVEAEDPADGVVRLTEQTNTVRYGRRECVLRAVELDPKHANAWYNLGLTLEESERVTVLGKEYTKAECLAKGGSGSSKQTLSSYH